MGIEPFLVSSTLNLAIAQRLVRKICEKCRASAPLSDEEISFASNFPELKELFKKKGYPSLEKALFYKGAGCKSCGQTGYSGRIGIFECIEMTDTIKSLVTARAPSNEIENGAVKEGMVLMLEDGLEKALSGITTFSEALRVTIGQAKK
jgi:type II secretory ATPase GspE/PulE/Tfp pilus assembly ATPase PilB-like protein